ncbi:MAG TPA: SGNH hydrolase domain-containing protein [Solirubrobacteraceae bacterium]|nr:SGNH hydrolase domain-containing protein [Solirubrobacteraceae bacterium]
MRPRFVSGLAASALIAAVCLAGSSYVDAKIDQRPPATSAGTVTHPRCFGAASIAPGHSCHNPALNTMVVPSPALAPRLSNAPCATVRIEGAILVCGFGYQGPYPTATVALIGDSHASTWRAALQVLAQSERWRGISLTQTSCPLSAKTPAIKQPARSNCERWKRQLPKWLARHPEIRTAFVVAHTGGAVLETEGLSVFEAQARGYREAWRTLVPASVRHIVVIRDNPGTRLDVLACVKHAIARHEDAGVACEVPRASALAPDPEALAAQELHSPRVKVIELTQFFCGSEWCRPVIGGALVYKDVGHLTSTYMETVGPYLKPYFDAVLGIHD